MSKSYKILGTLYLSSIRQTLDGFFHDTLNSPCLWRGASPFGSIQVLYDFSYKKIILFIISTTTQKRSLHETSCCTFRQRQGHQGSAVAVPRRSCCRFLHHAELLRLFYSQGIHAGGTAQLWGY